MTKKLLPCDAHKGTWQTKTTWPTAKSLQLWAGGWKKSCPFCFSQENYGFKISAWFQPIWKNMIVKMEIFPKLGWKFQKSLKPPSRHAWISWGPFLLYGHDLHPWNLTWNLKRSPWKRRFLLETMIFRFHVKFRGSTSTPKRRGWSIIHHPFHASLERRIITVRRWPAWDCWQELSCLTFPRSWWLNQPISKILLPNHPFQ